jgi:outer membrane receptor protein involved in Fe transport
VDGTSGVTIASTQFIEPDSLDNYELGTKFSLFERRLEITADVYRIEWEGLPFLTRAPSAAEGGCGVNYFTNVGSSTSEGVELQANFQATEALRIDVGGSWVDAKLTEDVPAQGYRAGDQLPGAPEYTANLALQYEFGLGQHEAFVRADSIYVGRFYSQFAQTPLTETADYVKVNLTAQVAFNQLGVKLFVDNLTNADEFTIRTTPGGGFRLRPRTVGLQLDYNF